MKRSIRLTLSTTVALLLLSVSTLAIFTNGGFESASLTGWTESTFLNFGLTGSQPYSGSSIVRTAGGSDSTTVVGPGAPLTLTDGLVPAVQYPRFGQYAGRVNFNLSNRNSNALRQQATVAAGDVDPIDSQVHIRLAYLPVLESPGHAPHEQPYFYIVVRNLTKSSVVWEKFTFANEAGVPWQTSGGFVYTAWQLVDATGPASVMAVGDLLEIEVVAAGCSLGGHRGHVYVDSFGATIPGGTVTATAPVTTMPGAALTYNLSAHNGGSAALDNTVVSIAIPAQTTFASVSDGSCSHSGGVVTCNFGSLPAGDTRLFDLIVDVGVAASGNITLGNYSIAGTGYPALLGPTRTTTVNAPVANVDSYTTAEEAPLTVAAPGVLANDTGAGLTAVLVTPPAHGTVSLASNGGFTYTPAANYAGPDSFIYRAVSAGGVQSQNANVLLTVTGVPDAPTAVVDSYTVAEDTTLTVPVAGVLANDTDPDAGTTLTAVLVSGTANGALTFNSNGSFVYTPAANYTGPDSFTYRANDGGLDSNTVTVSLTVNNVNDPPTATADAYTTAEDTPLTVAAAGVLANDADIDPGAVLAAVLVTGPTNGTLTLNPNGGFLYTPNANYNGPDSFVYRASDGTAQSGNTTVSLNVTAVNDAPTTAADAYSTAEDTPLTVAAPGILANDSDTENSSLTAVLVSGPTNGTLTLNPNGGFLYTPNANYNGPDGFVYRATDGTTPSVDTAVTLTVTAVNDAPTAAADNYSTAEDTPLTVAAAGVLANDGDVDTGTTLATILLSGPFNGTLTLNPNGGFLYTPNANYHGPDVFVYRATDGTAQTGDTSVSLTVTAVNDAPTATADSYTTVEDTPLTIAASGVLVNDGDVDAGAVLTAVLVTGPTNGTLALNPNGGFLYTPNANYNGPDSFVYRASDGTAQSGDTAVSLTVTAVNDAPTATADSYTTAEDTPLTVAAPGVLSNDTDVDAGTVLAAVLVSGPTNGTLTLNADGSFTYTPNANYNGPDSFVYRASDGTVETANTTVSLTVSSVADAPTGATDGIFTTTEDGSLTVPAPGVLGNDTDGDGDPLTAVLVSGPANGTLTLNPDGSFVYTPNANYNGPDGFVYRASDGTLQSANTSVTLSVTAVEDPPTASNDGGGAYTTNEDGSLTIPAPGVLANDVDPDGDPLTPILVTGPTNGTLTLNPDGSFVYTPNANYNGPDSFTYAVSDGDQTSAPATVTLTVNAVNDPPTAVANTYSVSEDNTIVVPASSGVLANDTDVDVLSTLTAILVSGPSNGTLTLNPDGSFTYVPDPNFNGTDSFTYQVSDGTATSTPVVVTLVVGDDVLLTPSSGRDTGGTRVTIEGTGFGPAGTPVTVTIGGVPGLEAEVLDDGHITFVTPALPANTPVDVVFAVNGGAPETLPGAYLPLPVPAPGSPTDTDGDGTTDEIEIKYGLDPTNPGDADDDPDNDGVPSNTEIITGTHPNAPYLRYFAEGINNTVFNTGIAIANASAATMEVQVTFFRQGQAPARHNITLAGRTRMTLNTATVAGMADAAFGVEVAGNEAVSADRTTFWDLGGREAHSEHAVEASPTWYFAEGATTGRFSLFYLLTNPSSQPANATVTFLRQVGAPITKQVVIPGYARVTIPVNSADPGLASADLGGKVTADRPIVAERSMYLSSPTKIWEAGTGGTGVTSPSNRWFFGEGATGSFFDAWILLSNPGATDATVDVRYVADSGADVTRTHTVPAGRRITIRVVDEDPAMMNTSFATFVTSTNAVPVVAERAMWWRSNEGYWTAGHVGVGFTEGGKKWVTADGVAAANGSSDTYALISNTENRAGLLKVTAVFGDGTAPVERLFAIGANQRFTIRGRQRFPEVVGKGYSFIIESIGAAPVDIVVDHSTYFDMDGRFWAMGTTSPGSKIK